MRRAAVERAFSRPQISPGSVWYATRIRREPHHTAPDGQKVVGDVYHIYVDFDAELPDALFEAPRVGKVE